MKKRITGILVFLFIVFPNIVFSAEVTCADLVSQSERLWMQNNYNASDRLLDQAIKKCPDLSELYWRKARNEYDRIEAIPRDKKPDKESLIKRYRKMERLADICIKKNPKDGNGYFWKGAAMGRRGTTQGILKSLSEADDLENDLLEAEKFKPKYRSANGAADTLGDTYTALGQFYRLVPGWLCVFPFKQIFGICGDVDKSLAYQKKAAALEPMRIEYAKELGVSLLCVGQKEDKPELVSAGKKILKKLQSFPELKPSDVIDKKHALVLLRDPSIACGYSRDAQQEQSRDGYDK